MILISLRDFILTGNFGPIQLGMQKDEITSLLGEKNGYQEFNTGFSGCNYGGYEFYYDNGQLFTIQNDHLLADYPNHNELIEFENEKFKIEPWFLKSNQNISYAEVIALLQAEGISFIEKNERGYIGINFESGVVLDFKDTPSREKDSLRLNSIYKSIF